MVLLVTVFTTLFNFHSGNVHANQSNTFSETTKTASINPTDKSVEGLLPKSTPKVASCSQSNDLPYEVDERRLEAIPFRKVIKLSSDLRPGSTKVTVWGQTGQLEKTFRVTYKGEKPIHIALHSTRVVKRPVDMEIAAGYADREARALPSRSGVYTRVREIDMLATGYSPYEGSSRGICANGMRAGLGVVAVDPRVIPLGSKLYIDGYGYAYAGDTGGAIKGHRIDLGLNSYHEANMIGRRYVHVYVISEGR